MLNLNYDKQFDILYVSTESAGSSYGDESTDGLVVFRDLFTEDITGIIIFSFKEKQENGTLPPLPIDIGHVVVDSSITV